MEKVYIILVHYKNWNDTIECIESIIKNEYTNIQIVVVENNSGNDSIKHLVSWAEGNEIPQFDAPEKLKQYVIPLSGKPLPYLVYTVEEAIKGGDKKTESNNYSIIFIENKKDSGFAGGNNIGLKYALAKGDMAYAWLLNNDTVIETSTLSNLVNRAKSEQARENKTGIVGSKLRFYNRPDVIQAIGGVFNVYTTKNYQKGLNQVDTGQFDKEPVQIDYVIGASMFVAKEFLEDVGLMSEEYHLYFEELDWNERGKRKGWQFAVASNSIVYHKQGVSTGKKATSAKRPLYIACLQSRNLLLFYKLHYPLLLPIAYLRLASKVLKNIIQGENKEAALILKIIFGKRTCERDVAK